MRIKPEDLKNYIGKKIRLNAWLDYEFFILNAVGKQKIIGYKDRNATEERVYYINENENIGDKYFWETYEEPKKKVKMWQWIYKDWKGLYYIPQCFHKNENEARCSNVSEESKLIQRADWTCIEVDE